MERTGVRPKMSLFFSCHHPIVSYCSPSLGFVRGKLVVFLKVGASKLHVCGSLGHLVRAPAAPKGPGSNKKKRFEKKKQQPEPRGKKDPFDAQQVAQHRQTLASRHWTSRTSAHAMRQLAFVTRRFQMTIFFMPRCT